MKSVQDTLQPATIVLISQLSYDQNLVISHAAFAEGRRDIGHDL